MHTWEMAGRSVMQEKGNYRRWGVIGRLGCTRDMVSEEEYAANQHATKNERHSWGRGSGGSATGRDALESRIFSMFGGKARRRKTTLFYLRRKKQRVGKWTTRNNMDALKCGRFPMRICDTHESHEKKVAIHIGNSTSHSRRGDHWVPPNRGGGQKTCEKRKD